MRTLALWSTLLWSSIALAQSEQAFNFGSSPNPVGSGARALGWGSAFIAVADDATAASWNPGGLIALEKPETSLVLSVKDRNEYLEGVGIEEKHDLKRSTYGDLNYFSVAYPFKLQSRFFVASLNYQALIDFDKRLRRTYFSSGESLRTQSEIRFRQKGALRALTPALAFQLSPRLALGVALTVFTDKLGYPNGWVQRESVSQTRIVLNNPATATFESRDRYGLNGVGANLGALWDVTPRWTVGAVVKTPVWGALTRKQLRLVVDGEAREKKELKESIRLPPSYGVGGAYRYDDALTVSVDVYRTEWSLFWQEKTSPVTGEKRTVNPISGEGYDKAKVSGITQAHVGAEYLFILERTVVPARVGVFFDPEPGAKGSSHFLGLALGTGISLFGVVVDAAYQFRFALDASPDVVDARKTPGTTTVTASDGTVWQHLFYLSAIYHF